MSTVSYYIEKDRQELLRNIKQDKDIDLSFEDIDGLIAKFLGEYRDNKFSIYSKDKQAYLNIDMKDPNYIMTIVVYNRTNGRGMEVDYHRGQVTPPIDLDRLIEEE